MQKFNLIQRREKWSENIPVYSDLWARDQSQFDLRLLQYLQIDYFFLSNSFFVLQGNLKFFSMKCFA